MTTSPLRRILVVDDEPEILAELAGYLRRRGEFVVTGSSYGEGMRALNDGAAPIDIVITDARMPDGNGIDLLRSAIEHAGGPRVCILMTGHMAESDLATDLQEADIVLMYKPFSLATLYREMLSAWDATATGRASPGTGKPRPVNAL